MRTDRQAVVGARQDLWLGPRTLTGTIPLLCLPHAGGGASVYGPWVREGLPGLPSVPVVPVRLPGREQRIDEAQPAGLESLLEMMLAALDRVLAGPFALFGHSLGALIAFELARRCHDRTGNEPVRLFVSGQRAPGPGAMNQRISGLPDEELIESISEFGGLPAAVRDNRELLALMLPRIRTDLVMYESHEYVPGPPLGCPVSVFGGLDDAWVSRAGLEAWQACTSGEMRLRVYEGGHFFHLEHQHEILAAIADDLPRYLRGGQPAGEMR